MRSKLTTIEREDGIEYPLAIPEGLPVIEEDGEYIVEFVPKRFGELHDYWDWNGIVLESWQVEAGEPVFRQPVKLGWKGRWLVYLSIFLLFVGFGPIGWVGAAFLTFLTAQWLKKNEREAQ